MLHQDYVRFLALQDYHTAQLALEDIAMLGDDHSSCTHGQLDLDPEMLKLVKDEIKPVLDVAVAHFEDVYDRIGPDSDEMDNAADAMVEICDRAWMALEAAQPPTDQDFDLRDL